MKNFLPMNSNTQILYLISPISLLISHHYVLEMVTGLVLHRASLSIGMSMFDYMKCLLKLQTIYLGLKNYHVGEFCLPYSKFKIIQNSSWPVQNIDWYCSELWAIF